MGADMQDPYDWYRDLMNQQKPQEPLDALKREFSTVMRFNRMVMLEEVPAKHSVRYRFYTLHYEQNGRWTQNIYHTWKRKS